MQFNKKLLFFLVFVYPVLAHSQVVNMVFTSDVHFGIFRENFRGDKNVSANIVNAAAIQKMNSLPGYTLPEDSGVAAGQKIVAIDYFILTGDITNRMDVPYQAATASWAQFSAGYMHQLTLKDQQHKLTKLLLVPGNHDLSNVLGTSKPMTPATDPTAMVKLFNLMMKPAPLKTNATYNYLTDKINYSVNVQGIHMIFVTLWPDSVERIWMQHDLQKVPETTPVIIFCHDPPTADPKHFTNPLPPYNMTVANRFENLLKEHYKESTVAEKGETATDIEQRGFVKFLKLHPNIKAYFHGHNNYTEYYVYHGPDNDIALNTFRVDSPMKGAVSAKDETKLSFQLLSIDPIKQNLTVRECLWNTDPASPSSPIIFGDTKTVSLKVN